MALDALIRSALATAHRTTASLQVNVSIEAWIASDAYGAPVFATAVQRPALVEYKQQLRRATDGQEVMQRARVTFTEPLASNGAANRREPIDPRDKIVLPDGTTGPILDVSGLADPSTGLPYSLEVALG